MTIPLLTTCLFPVGKIAERAQKRTPSDCFFGDFAHSFCLLSEKIHFAREYYSVDLFYIAFEKLMHIRAFNLAHLNAFEICF